MDKQLESRNFEFLRTDHPLLVEYALRAELNAYSDPNTSLIKTRQVAECMARSIACRAGMDCSDNEFDAVLGLLRRQDIVPRHVLEHLEHTQRFGNAAAHKHLSDPRTALQALICAYEAAKWFAREVLRKPDFQRGPFRPLPTPKDATLALKEEIEHLQQQVVRDKLAATATEAQFLEQLAIATREAADYQQQAEQYKLALVEQDRSLIQLETQFTDRLRRITRAAQSKPFQSFVDRSNSLGRRNEESLPLFQLRISTGMKSRCHGETMIVVQISRGGFITQICPKCLDYDTKETLSYADFVDLNLYIACARCSHRAEPGKVKYSNYGYRCPHCGWTVELALLLPEYSDIRPFDDEEDA
ncbi:MAG TPA: hypothetical protein DD670_07415 [Planctomycetaceae bacterium]|nr:hypothetical protein [Planctomycetaceae bacterium]